MSRINTAAKRINTNVWFVSAESTTIFGIKRFVIISSIMILEYSTLCTFDNVYSWNKKWFRI